MTAGGSVFDCVVVCFCLGIKRIMDRYRCVWVRLPGRPETMADVDEAGFSRRSSSNRSRCCCCCWCSSSSSSISSRSSSSSSSSSSISISSIRSSSSSSSFSMTRRWRVQVLGLDPGQKDAACKQAYFRVHLCDWREYNTYMKRVLGIVRFSSVLQHVQTYNTCMKCILSTVWHYVRRLRLPFCFSWYHIRLPFCLSACVPRTFLHRYPYLAISTTCMCLYLPAPGYRRTNLLTAERERV